MTRLEKFHEAKRLVDALKAHIEAGKDSRCDKFGCTVKISDTYKGYYGNSSCSSWADGVVKALERVAAANHVTLATWALAAAEREMALAAKAAQDEANEVLAAVGEGASR